METLQGKGYLLRNLFLMVLLGFLTLVMAGPILAVLGVLLPFFIVGALVWLFIKAIFLGPLVVGRIIGKTFRTALAVPVWAARKTWSGAGWVLSALSSLVLSFASFLILVGGGAGAGAILGAIGGMQHHDADVRVPAGALIGAAIGLLAVLWRPKKKDVVVVQPAAEFARQA